MIISPLSYKDAIIIYHLKSDDTTISVQIDTKKGIELHYLVKEDNKK